MTGRCGPRITHFTGSRFGVSPVAPILWEIEVPEIPGDGVRHIALTIMRTNPRSAVGACGLCGISLSARIGADSSVVSSRASVSSHTTLLAQAFRDHHHPGAARTDVGY